MNSITQRLENLSPAQRELLKQRLSQESAGVQEPIAIVGMACRFPEADNLQQYWDLILRGGNATQVIPRDRFPVEQLYHKDYDTPGKLISKWACLREDLGYFDPKFFGIAPREASRMDPQQRMLLEVAWEAMEHAGIPPAELSKSPTGVFIGVSQVDYIKLAGQFDDFLEMIDAHTGTGNSLSLCANRLSYVFNFSGPSASVDTACSSGLVALHHAVQSLRARECDAALAGAANICITPDSMISLSRARMVSPTGQCRPFHQDADGYVRGEGSGVVVLKRLSDAIETGDRVLAVLRHTAVNHGGRTSGITAPNGSAQVRVMRKALAGGGVSPSEIDYIEAHGTGTPLGDPIEVEALGEVYRQQTPDDRPVYLTSVKANIGHLEIAAGIAGLIKAVMVLRSRTVPQQPGLDTINPRIRTEGTRIRIPTETTSLGEPGSRHLAGVSSFGFGGTNAHAVIESVADPDVAVPSENPRDYHLLTLSAQSDDSLKSLAASYRDVLETLDFHRIGDFCHAAAVNRTHHPRRATVRVESKEQLLADLKKLAAGKKSPSIRRGNVQFRGRGRIGFLFTGQGSQIPGMGCDLYHSQPVFRDMMDQCEAFFQSERGESLLTVMFDENAVEKLNDTAWTQPALFALEVSLAMLWKSWGITPCIVMGHSVGEYAAAYMAGVFSLKDGLRLIAKRGELMSRLPAGGAMAVVFDDEAAVIELLKPFEGRLEIAALNGPENTTVSGTEDALQELISHCESVGVGCQRLTVSHAFHSHLMDPILDEFEQYALSVEFSAPDISLISNLTGELVDEQVTTPSYWREHIRGSVQFSHGVATMSAEELDALIEIGPTPALVGMAKRCMPDWSVATIASLRKGKSDVSALMDGVADLFVAGGTLDWAGVDRPWSFNQIDLPSYPFDRQYYWLESEGNNERLDDVFGLNIIHPLLGKSIRAAESTIFQCKMRSSNPESMRDHVVQGSTLVPGSGFTEMGFAAATELLGEGSHRVEDLSFQQALFLSDVAKNVQMVVSPPSGSRYPFRIYSQGVVAGSSDGWELNATGTIVRASAQDEALSPPEIDLDKVRGDVVRTRDHDEFYEIMRQRNLNYGPTYQIMDGLAQTATQAIAPMRFHEDVLEQLKQYAIPPAVGDGAMHCAGGVVPPQLDGSFTPYTYLPTSIRCVRRYAALTEGLDSGGVIAVAQRTSDDDSESPESVTADVFLTDVAGRCLIHYQGVSLRRLSRAAEETERSDPRHWLYQWGWTENDEFGDTLNEPPESAKDETILILADQHQISERLAKLVAPLCERTIVVTAGDRYSGPTASSYSSNEVQGIERYEVNAASEEHFERLIQELKLKPKRPLRVVHAWSVDVENPVGDGDQQLARSRELSASSSLFLYRYISKASLGINPSFLIVTRGGQIIDDEHPVHFLQQEMIGIGRAATLEYGGFSTRLIDVDPQDSADDAAQQLLRELFLDSEETQVAWRDHKRWCGRLQRLDRLQNSDSAPSIPTGTPFHLMIAGDNTIEGLRYKPFRRSKPVGEQVEIRVAATGLNFSDILKSLGLYPGITDDVVPIGIECSGVVSAIGDEVHDLQVGDEVMGIVPYGFGSHCVTSRQAVVGKPDALDFEEAAIIPIAFMTAHHCLIDVARLQKGERVLIHAGAGGVGLAAIQIAQSIGAEVFATAGSDNKREYLEAIGADHVMNSRTVEFADQIMEITQGRGVDVVLNSLPGDAIDHSLAVLAEYGRFVEIGKVDIYQNKMIGLLPFQRNLSYTAVDLDRMFRQRPAQSQELLASIMRKFEDGAYQPPNMTVFDAEQVVDAFRYMSRRQNIGKIVVSMPSIEVLDSSEEERGIEALVHPASTYLVTGGLGALGRKVAGWLANLGADCVVLTSRRDPSADVIDELAALSRQFPGTKFVAMSTDVSSAESLANTLRQIDTDLPPLRGVIHAAGVVENQFMVEMDMPTYDRNTAAKIRGGWNLHQATLDRQLDFFVLFSSVSTIVGTIQQSAYGAANAFLDGLAHYRRSIGLPVTAVNWGPWGEVGMAAESGSDLASRGMLSLPAEPSLDLMGELMAEGRRQATVMIADWPKLIRAYEALRRSGIAPPMFEQFQSAKDIDENARAEAKLFHAKLSSLPAAQREEELRSYLTRQIAQIMGLEPSDLDVNQSLNTMGLDSLMAIELANQLQLTLQVALPMSIFIENPTVATLARQSTIAMEGGQADEPSSTSSADIPSAHTPADSPASDSQPVGDELAEPQQTS